MKIWEMTILYNHFFDIFFSSTIVYILSSSWQASLPITKWTYFLRSLEQTNLYFFLDSFSPPHSKRDGSGKGKKISWRVKDVKDEGWGLVSGLAGIYSQSPRAIAWPIFHGCSPLYSREAKKFAKLQAGSRVKGVARSLTILHHGLL